MRCSILILHLLIYFMYACLTGSGRKYQLYAIHTSKACNILSKHTAFIPIDLDTNEYLPTCIDYINPSKSFGFTGGGSSPSNTDSSVFFSHPSLLLNEKYTHTGLLNTKLLEKKSLNVIKVQSANKLHGSLHPRNHLNRISQHFKIIIGNNWCLKRQTFLFTWVLRALWGCLRCINSLLWAITSWRRRRCCYHTVVRQPVVIHSSQQHDTFSK